MKKIHKIISGFLVATVMLVPFVVSAQVQNQPWKVLSNILQPVLSSYGIQVPSLGSSGNPCLSVNTTGLFATTTCGSGGGSSVLNTNPFQATYFQATSTIATSSFPIASSTKICLGGVCNTTWPSGGGGGSVPVGGTNAIQFYDTSTTLGGSQNATIDLSGNYNANGYFNINPPDNTGFNLNGGVSNNEFSIYRSYPYPNQYYEMGLGNTISGGAIADKQFVFGGGSNPGLTVYDYVNQTFFQIGGDHDYGPYLNAGFRVYGGSDQGVSMYGGSGSTLRVNNSGITTQNNILDDGSGQATFLAMVVSNIDNAGAHFDVNYDGGGIGSMKMINNSGSVVGSLDTYGNYTGNTFVKSGGTSAQILAADGSVITAGTNITISGGTISASGGGGSQTPWTSNINGGGYNLSNVGTISSTGNVSIDVTGSNTTSPRILGLSNLTSGTAARFQFGDGYNSIQTTFGGRQVWQSYWGIEVHGSRQTVASYAPFNTGVSTDPNFNVVNDNPLVTALAVTGASSQSGDLFDLMNNSGTKLDVITSTGLAGFGTSTPNYPLQATTQSTNATTTIEIGKAGQNKGSCLIMYNNSGTKEYVSIVGSALTVSTTACN